MENRIMNKGLQKSSVECKSRRHNDKGRAFSICLYSLIEREKQEYTSTGLEFHFGYRLLASFTVVLLPCQAC